MTDAEARKVLDTAAANARKAGKHDEAARIEVVREYLTNADFRQKLRDFVWEQTK